MNIFKAEGYRRCKDEDEDDPLKVGAVDDVEASLPHAVPLFVQLRLSECTAALAPESYRHH